MTDEVILQVKDLKTYFHVDEGIVKAVDGVSFNLRKGETLGIVGESGSGKSVTNLSIINMIPNPPGRIAGGEVLFMGKDLLKLPINEIRQIRGNKISMIFQDPMTSLNPFLRISTQMVETIVLHQGLDKATAKAKAIDMLKLAGIPAPEKRIDQYPHQFSGGMRQRVMIAMSLSCNPEILIADEPTSALDVTIQAQILDLMKDLTARLGTAVILITHSLGVVAGMCDTICVMYAGRVVERGATDGDLRGAQAPLHAGPHQVGAPPRQGFRATDSSPSGASRRTSSTFPTAAPSIRAATGLWTSASGSTPARPSTATAAPSRAGSTRRLGNHGR